MSPIRGIPQAILVAPAAFKGSFTAAEVAAAIARGLEQEGRKVDLCPLTYAGEGTPDAFAAALDEAGFDARMRAARAVVTGEGRLDQRSLAGKLVSEVATRARQAGVPCHAVVGSRELDSMGARVLDLDRVLVASTAAELEAAGRELAGLI